MATITRRDGASGPRYRAEVRIKQAGVTAFRDARTFRTRALAAQWAKRTESTMSAVIALRRSASEPMPQFDDDVDGEKVYLLGVREMAAVKIGRTRGPISIRLASLQTALPYPIRPLYVIPGDRALELRLHSVFSRYRLLGEWFVWCDDIRDAFEDLSAADAETRGAALLQIDRTDRHLLSQGAKIRCAG